jgi:hypothetical protein
MSDLRKLPGKSIMMLPAAAVALLFIFTVVGMASSGGSYVLNWATIDGGGGFSGGGSYSLSGSLGQPLAGEMSGGGYTLVSGFYSQQMVFYGAAPSSNPILLRFPSVIQAGAAPSGPNQWYARVVPGEQGDEGDSFHFVAWLHVPTNWTLPWATQYSFTGDFGNTTLSADWTAQSWVQNLSNCAYGGPADSGYKWRAFRGPEEALPALANRLNNQVNLRGGLGVPVSETSDLYGGVRVVIGTYYDSDGNSTPDSYHCDHVGVTNITVP